MTKEKVSVIIPVYNAEATLVKCLDSVCGQTYNNLEILLINDGSKDNSLEICELYAQRDSRIVLHTQKNAGPSAARNKGLDLATGEYIAFTDSDDYVEPDMIERLVAAAQENNVDMVICSFVEERDGSRYHKIAHPSGYYDQEMCWKIALDVIDNNSKTRIPPYSYIRLVRRSFFEETGLRYNHKIKRSEDYLLWTQVHFKIKSMYLMADAHLYHYVIQEGSITNSYLPGYWGMCKLLFAELNDKLPKEKEIRKRVQAQLIQRSLIALRNAARADSCQYKKELNEILDDKELLRAVWSVGLFKNSKRARVYALLVMLRMKWMIKRFILANV